MGRTLDLRGKKPSRRKMYGSSIKRGAKRAGRDVGRGLKKEFGALGRTAGREAAWMISGSRPRKRRCRRR